MELFERIGEFLRRFKDLKELGDELKPVAEMLKEKDPEAYALIESASKIYPEVEEIVDRVFVDLSPPEATRYAVILSLILALA